MKQNLKHFSYYFLLPLFLLIFAIFNVFNYLKTSEFGILNLDVRGNIDQLVSTRSGELMKGDIVYGKFHSSYPNLGIVSMRFYNQDRDSDDNLVFRIKEEGKINWYYEANYKTDQFMPHKTFPFGFPVIGDSEGKNYEFQIESLRGATGSGILVDSQSPVFIAKSTFNINDLLKDNKSLLNFLGNKVINVLEDTNSRLNILLFFLPLIYYAIFVLSKGISFQFLTGIALAVIIYDIFWLKENFDSLFIGILFLWSLISRRFHFESRIAGIFALGFLVITPLMLVFGQEALAEKAAVWAYLFLCVTVVQQIYELKKKPKNQFTLEKFKNNLFKFKLDQNNRFAQFIKHYFKPALYLLTLYILFKSALYLLTLYILFKSGQIILESLRLYQLFFPEYYLEKYIFETFIPCIIFLTVTIFVFLKAKKNFKNPIYLGLLISLTILIYSTIVTDISTKFRDVPTIISVSPNNFTEAWVDVTIRGENFQDLPNSGKVLINGVKQTIIDEYWKDNRVVFRTDPEKTKSGMLCIVTYSKTKTNCVDFKYNFKYK